LFVSLRGGLYDLVQALLDRLDGVTRHPNHKVRTVLRTGRGLYAVRLDDGTDWPAEAVVVATPAPVAAEATAALHPFIAQFLREVPYTSAATVSLGFAKRDLAEGLTGFGLVIPRVEKRPLMACTWTSNKFSFRADAEHVLVRGFIGGAHNS